MQDWLTNFELDTGKRKIKPYNPNIAKEIADLVRPQWGDAIPKDDNQLKRMFGFGWWKQDVAGRGRTAAEGRLHQAGQ